MIDTYAARVEEERERLRRRREVAGAVAAVASTHAATNAVLPSYVGGGAAGPSLNGGRQHGATQAISSSGRGVGDGNGSGNVDIDIDLTGEGESGGAAGAAVGDFATYETFETFENGNGASRMEGEDVEGGKEDYFWVPREWLSSFCDHPGAPAPIDTRSLLCLCPHPAADPAKASAAKRVSRAGWELMVDAAGLHPAAPVLRGGRSICAACLRGVARGVAGVEDAEAARAATRDVLKAWELNREAVDADAGDAIEESGKGGGMNGGFPLVDGRHLSASQPISGGGGAMPARLQDRPRTYLVSRTWLQRWTAWKSGLPPPSVAAGATAAITCVHGGLAAGARCAVVPEIAWEHLKVTTAAYDESGKESRRGREGGVSGDAAERSGGGDGGADIIEMNGGHDKDDGAVIDVDGGGDSGGVGGGDGSDDGGGALGNSRYGQIVCDDGDGDGDGDSDDNEGSCANDHAAAVQIANDAALAAAIAEVGADDVLIVGETGGPAHRVGKTTKSSNASGAKTVALQPRPRWAGASVTFPDDTSTRECQLCAAVKEGDATAAQERRTLADAHFSMCSDLLHRVIIDARDSAGGAVEGYTMCRQSGAGAGGGEDDMKGGKAEYRLMPARWLAQWREFATGGAGGKSGVGGGGGPFGKIVGGGGSGGGGGGGGDEEEEAFQPTHESLATAAASLRCHHNRLHFPLPRLVRTLAHAQWTQQDDTSEDRDGDAKGAGALEIVAASAFEVLEMVLQGHVEAVPHISVSFSVNPLNTKH
jgi:hypothetical protein